MLRRIALLSPLLILLACGVGAWVAARGLTDAFIAPGAADVRVAEVVLGQRVIAYRMPHPEDGWQSAIVRRLNLSGWSLVTDFYQWGDTEKYTPVYQRRTQLWFVQICERAQLLGDRSNAIISVSYRAPCP
jgi:hypothetical protein